MGIIWGLYEDMIWGYKDMRTYDSKQAIFVTEPPTSLMKCTKFLGYINTENGLPTGRLTWNLQITHLERNMIFQTSVIMFHVNLQGGNLNQRCWGFKVYTFESKGWSKDEQTHGFKVFGRCISYSNSLCILGAIHSFWGVLWEKKITTDPYIRVDPWKWC